MRNLRYEKNDVLRSLERKTDLRAMKSRHFAPPDLGLKDAKCVVLRQVFHT